MIRTGQEVPPSRPLNARLAAGWLLVLGIALAIPAMTLKYAGRK